MLTLSSSQFDPTAKLSTPVSLDRWRGGNTAGPSRPIVCRFHWLPSRKLLISFIAKLQGGHMKRRNFIVTLAGVAALRPTATSAQRPQRNVPLVGVIWLGTASDQMSVRIRQAFLRGLRENGYSEGQSITIEDRYFGDGPGPLGNAAEELVTTNSNLVG